MATAKESMIQAIEDRMIFEMQLILKTSNDFNDAVKNRSSAAKVQSFTTRGNWLKQCQLS